MSKKQKYLFVYLKTGGGRLAPARARFNYLNKYFADKTEPKLIYGFEKTPRWVQYIIEDGYRMLQYTGKWFFEFLYAINKVPVIARITCLLIAPFMKNYLEDVSIKEKPDKIVIFHFFLIIQIHRILKRKKLSIPVITVITDPFTPHPMWFLLRGHALFIGGGAYTAALLNFYFKFPPWMTIFFGGGVATLFGLIIGTPCLRLRGPYFALATFAAAAFPYGLTDVFWEVTGGLDGLYGITPIWPSLEGKYYFSVLLTAICCGLVYLGGRSKKGLILKSIREDEVAAMASGVNTTAYKLTTFVISGFLAGVAGAFYSHNQLHVGPETLSISLSVLVIIMSVVGGIGTITGPIAGAYLLTIFNEMMREWEELRLASTPTPVPAPVTQTVCHPSADSGLWCFALIQNNTAELIENVSVQMTLLEDNAILASQTAFMPLDILAPNSALPVYVFFPNAPANAKPQAQWLSALPGSGAGYLPAALNNTSAQIDWDGATAKVSGQVYLPNESTAATQVWVAAVAYDKNGTVVGVRRWEGGGIQPGSSLNFDFSVSSVGGEIEAVEFFVQVK